MIEISLRTLIISVLILTVLGLAGAAYHHIYNQGRTVERIEQKENFDKIKEKTDAAKTRALTADPDDVDRRLLDKYRRED